MAPIILVRRIWCKCGDMPPAIRHKASLLGKFAPCGLDRVSILRLNSSRRKLKSFNAQAVPVLFYEHNMVLIVQGDDLHPIRAFKNVERSDFHSIRGTTGIGANADPSVLKDVG